MPPKILFRLGLFLLFLSVPTFFVADHWLRTRIFTPLEYPVSLDAPELKSPPFRINLRETYFVSLHLDDSLDDYYADGRCSFRNIQGSKWRVYRVTSPVRQPRTLWTDSDTITPDNPYLYHAFIASPGQYQLEWTLPASASCLNPRHPKLRVFTGSYDYYQNVALAQIACLFLSGTGLVLALTATFSVRSRFLAVTEAPRMFPDMVLRNVLPMAKHAPLPLIHDPPHWPLVCCSILWVLILTFMMWAPLPRRGLFVRWPHPNTITWQTSPWPDALEVYVAPSHFFINGQEVSRNALRPKLAAQLSHRAEWTVYFEADPNTAYMDAIYAIDTIQECDANLVWVTPKMRQQWQRNALAQGDSPTGPVLSSPQSR